MKKLMYGVITVLLVIAVAVPAVVLASDADVSIADVTEPSGSVTLAPGESGDIIITITVTGRQAHDATFEIYRDWTLSEGEFTGSRSQEFTVYAREAQDPATIFNTTGTVTVAAGQDEGTFTLVVGVTVTSTSAPAALAARNSSEFDLIVEASAAPADTSPPVITINSPADWAIYLLNEVVYAAWDAEDVDSGVNWDETWGTVDSGELIDTSTVGEHTFYVYAEDNAGNWAELTHTYYVVYDFDGFLPPLVIRGRGNGLFKAGSTVPVKFQLFDANGDPVSTATGTVSIDTDPVASASIRYDAVAEQYIANLKTVKGVTGVHTVTVSLDDDTSYSIEITLR